MLRKKCNKYIILLIIQILIVLALLPGCFRKEQLVYSCTSLDLGILDVYMEEHTGLQSDFITLTPGVYQLKVWPNSSENQGMSVELCYESGSFQAIKTNAVAIFPGDEYIDFEAYVSDKLSTAYLQFEIANGDASALARAEVWQTSMGNRIMLFVMMLGFLLLDSMLLFRKKILEGKVSKEQQVVFWVLAAGILLAYFPYMTDYFHYVGDIGEYLSRIVILKDGVIGGGDFSAGFNETWLYDYRYAESSFLGNLLLYIPALFMVIGFSLMTSYKMFVFLGLISTAIIVYFSLKKCVKDNGAAVFGSVVYLLVPHYLQSIYERGALGDFLAMIFLPLICCGIYLLYAEDSSTQKYKTYKWYVILGMSGIIQCNFHVVEIMVVVMVLICILLYKKTFRKHTFLQLLEAAGLTLLINAWFLIPLFYTLGKEHISISIWKSDALFVTLTFVILSLTSIVVSWMVSRFVVHVKASGGTLKKLALGVVGAVVLVTAVYYVNRIAVEKVAVYLYEEESIRTVITAKSIY